MKITGYIIVVEDYFLDIGREVERNLNNGWELYGPPFTGKGGSFRQAMIKYEKKESISIDELKDKVLLNTDKLLSKVLDKELK